MSSKEQVSEGKIQGAESVGSISDLFTMDESQYTEDTEDSSEETQETENPAEEAIDDDDNNSEDSKVDFDEENSTEEDTDEDKDVDPEPNNDTKDEDTKDQGNSNNDNEGEEEDDGEFFGGLIELFVENAFLEPIVNPETGEEQKVPNSEEGLKQLLEYNSSKKAQDLFSEMYSSLNENDAKAVKYILEGGSLSEWEKIQGSDTIGEDFDISKEDNQETVIRKWFESQDLEDSEINEMIETYKDSDTMEKQAKLAKKQYLKLQHKEREKSLEAEKNRKEEERKRLEEEAVKFKDTVMKAEKIKGFELSKKDRQELYDYVTKPIDDKGNTQSELDVKDDLDTALLIEYLKMKDFDFSKLEKKIASKEKINLRKKLSNYTDSHTKGSSGKGNQGNGNSPSSEVPVLPWTKNI